MYGKSFVGICIYEITMTSPVTRLLRKNDSTMSSTDLANCRFEIRRLEYLCLKNKTTRKYKNRVRQEKNSISQ